jgi:hypothetical protein
VIGNRNAFEAPMDAARVCSPGQITHALFEVGGQCRRSTWRRRASVIAAAEDGDVRTAEPGSR